MKLKEFSVTNYRSITSAHKISMQNFTVLVGKNNEGKSNLLTALNVAMTSIMLYCRKPTGVNVSRYKNDIYEWERDFPIQFRERKNGLESIFKLVFKLDENELQEFHLETKTRGNDEIPISIKIGRDNVPKVDIPKRGSSSYTKNSRIVTEFITKRISFNYIQAIRTDRMAINTLQNAILNELQTLKNNPEYVEAQEKVDLLEQKVLDNMSQKLLAPLSTFLPNLKQISLKRIKDDYYERLLLPFYREEIDVIIDDGIPTSISTKGDGIKSLVTLAILKDQKVDQRASIIAIEEPESHLHSGAIHGLVDVISKMSKNSQVIITTHNPLFVQQNKLMSNILVDNGTARPAKSIAEIRNILGVWPSDNLKNARFVLVVEGEDDKISLSKILPVYSEVIRNALSSNLLVIKPLAGASNLSHDLLDLKNNLCKYAVLLDNDKAGEEAANKAINNNLLRESEIRFTICNGSPRAEFEDCLNPKIYKDAILNEFNVSLDCTEFRGNNKWSDRVKNAFLSQGAQWNDKVEEKVKYFVANSIPEKFNLSSIKDILIENKAGFIKGIVNILEKMIQE